MTLEDEQMLSTLRNREQYLWEALEDEDLSPKAKEIVGDLIELNVEIEYYMQK